MRNLAKYFDASTIRLGVGYFSAENHYAFAGVITRAPEEIALVRADGFRQAVFGAEKIDGAGLAVIVTVDRGFFACLGRQAVIGSRYLRDHFGPAELVGENLLQRAFVRDLGFRRRKADRLLVFKQRFNRQNRQDHWRNDHGHHDNQNGQSYADKSQGANPRYNLFP